MLGTVGVQAMFVSADRYVLFTHFESGIENY